MVGRRHERQPPYRGTAPLVKAESFTPISPKSTPTSATPPSAKSTSCSAWGGRSVANPQGLLGKLHQLDVFELERLALGLQREITVGHGLPWYTGPLIVITGVVLFGY